jgi:large subunit ribosomal protein L18
MRVKTSKDRLTRRHLRLRNKIAGTPERPRIFARKSLRHLYVQVIDDSQKTGSKTLFAASTADGGKEGGHFRNIKSATEFGKRVGADLKNKGISTVVFDRGGYKYHGVVKALADGLREAGLEF